MKIYGKRFLAVLVAVMMLISALPMGALAEGATQVDTTNQLVVSLPDAMGYTVTYIPNSGIWQDGYEGEKTVAAQNAADRKDIGKEGHELLGWYQSLSDEKPYDFGDAGSLQQNISVEAKWQALTYEVKFLDEDGAPLHTQQVAYGKRLAEADGDKTFAYGGQLPAKEGRTFKDWVSNTDGDTVLGPGMTFTARYAAETLYKLTVGYRSEDGAVLYPNHESIYEEGQPFSVSSPEIPGYALQNEAQTEIAGVMSAEALEDAGFAVTPPAEGAARIYGVSANVTYVPATVGYTVRHWLQNVNDDGYTQVDETVVAEDAGHRVGEAVALTANAYEGFALRADAILSKTLASADNVFDLYYDRNVHQVYFDSDGGTYYEPVDARYGASLPQGDRPERMGYAFEEWQWYADAGYSQAFAADAMPDQDLYVKAVWTPSDASYQISIWAENANDKNYTNLGLIAAPSQSGAEIVLDDGTKAMIQHGFEGLMNRQFGNTSVREHQFFQYNAKKTEDALAAMPDKTVASDGTTIVNVYFDRNEYTLQFALSGGNYVWTSTNSWSDNGLESGSRKYVGTAPTLKVSGKTSILGKSMYAITAKYGADISSKWPSEANQTYDNVKFVSWATTKTVANPYGYAKQHPSNTNIKGVYKTMSAEIVADPADPNAVHTMLAYWASPYTYNYKYYYELLEEEKPAQVGDRAWNGKVYRLRYEEKVPSTATLGQQSPSDQYGMKKVGGPVDEGGAGQGKKGNYDTYFYYDRLNFNITYVNGGNATKSDGIPYETTLSAAKHGRALTAEDYPYGKLGSKDWEFGGWYTDQACTVPMDWNAQMAANFTVYAKWIAPKYAVTFDPQGGEWDGEPTLQVAEGQSLAKPEAPERKGYTFLGWYVTVNGKEQRYLFSASQKVYGDMTLTAKWAAEETVDYSVYYGRYENGIWKDLQAPQQKKGLVGETVVERAAGIEAGNWYPQDAYLERELGLEAEGNVIRFVYVQKDAVAYAVYHVAMPEDGRPYATEAEVRAAEQLAPAESCTSTGATAAVQAAQILGYTPASRWSDTLALKAEGNYYVFYYTITTQPTGGVTVRYFFMDDSGQYPAAPLAVVALEKLLVGQRLSASDYAQPGTYNGIAVQYDLARYQLDAARSDSYAIATDSVTSTMNLYFALRKYEYKVEHLLQNDEGEYDSQETETKPALRIGARATYGPKSYRGYVYEPAKTEAPEGGFVIPADNSLVIKLYYAPIEYRISYVLNGSAQNPAVNAAENPQTYTVLTPDIHLQDATRTGYLFAGWYKDAGLADAADGVAIAKGSTGDKVFYAKWTADTRDLRVEGIEKVYDGSAYSASVSGQLPGDVTEYSVDGGATWQAENPGFTDAKTHPVIVRVSRDGVEIWRDEAEVVISQRPLKLTVNTQSYLRDGEIKTVLANGQAFVVDAAQGADDGLLAGDAVSAQALYGGESGGKAEVGEYAVALEAIAVTNAGGDVTKNYAIATVPGALIIRQDAALNVEKQWTTAPGEALPGSVTVQLQKNGVATDTTAPMTAESGWKASFTGLYQYEAAVDGLRDDTDKPINYSAVETLVDGKTPAEAGYAVESALVDGVLRIVNASAQATSTIQINGQKVWSEPVNDESGEIAAALGVVLEYSLDGGASFSPVMNGESLLAPEWTAYHGKTWTFKFHDQPQYLPDAQGALTQVTYRVRETGGYEGFLPQDGGIAPVDGSGNCTLTNARAIVDLNWTKVWDYSAAPQATRMLPEWYKDNLGVYSVGADGALTAVSDAEISVNATGDNWTIEAKGLPAIDENGAEVQYVIREKYANNEGNSGKAGAIVEDGQLVYYRPNTGMALQPFTVSYDDENGRIANALLANVIHVTKTWEFAGDGQPVRGGNFAQDNLVVYKGEEKLTAGQDYEIRFVGNNPTALTQEYDVMISDPQADLNDYHVYEQHVRWGNKGDPVQAGSDVYYRGADSVARRYQVTYGGSGAEQTIANVEMPALTVSKQWVGGAPEGINEITLRIYRYVDGSSDAMTEIGDVTLSANGWTQKIFTQKGFLDQAPGNDTGESGSNVRYVVREVDDAGNAINDGEMGAFGGATYVANYRESRHEITITNTRAQQGAIAVKKVWNDDDDRDGLRPKIDSFQMTLYAGEADATGEPVTNWQSDETGNIWTATVADMPLYDDRGTLIEYTVKEDAIPGYNVENGVPQGQEASGTAADGALTLSITNAHESGLYNGDGVLRATKAWNDGDDRDGIRPDSVTVQLKAMANTDELTPAQYQAGGTDAASLTLTLTADGWSGEFTNLLAKYKGVTIRYELVEISAQKGGQTYEVQNGKLEIPYPGTTNDMGVYEVAVGGVANGAVTITNAHAPAAYNANGVLAIVKDWQDQNDGDGIRPQSVTVRLSANDKGLAAKEFQANSLSEEKYVELVIAGQAAENEWSGAISGLYRFHGGQPIRYAVEETTVGDVPVANGVAVGLPSKAQGSEYRGDYAVEVSAIADGSVTIINGHVPAPYNGDGALSVTKTWLDGKDAHEPVQVALTAKANGADVPALYLGLDAEGLTIPLTDGTGRWTGLPRYYNGVEIEYAVKEVGEDQGLLMVGEDKYKVTYAASEGAVAITNALLGDFEFAKTWVDGHNASATRPSEADFLARLTLVNGPQGATPVLVSQASSGGTDIWRYKYEDLPLYGPDNEKIAYAAREINDVNAEITGGHNEIFGQVYNVTYGALRDGTYNITNWLHRDVVVTKVWETGGDPDAERTVAETDQLNLTLTGGSASNGQYYRGGWDKAGDGTWTYTFIRQQWYDWNGNLRLYGVEETNPPEDYEVAYSQPANDALTITNTYKPKTVSATVNKIWVDEGAAAERPNVTFTLYDGGATPIASKALEGAGPVVFENLPRFAEVDGVATDTPIAYTVVEVMDGQQSEGYAAEVVLTATDGETGNLTFTATNTKVGDIVVTKNWVRGADGQLPEDLALTLTGGGNPLNSTADGWVKNEDTWTYTFADVPLYDNDGAIAYAVTESVPDGYTPLGGQPTANVASNAASLTNFHNSAIHPFGEITGTKAWLDADENGNHNADGSRPEAADVVLKLMQKVGDGEWTEVTGATAVWTASGANDATWSYAIDAANLPAIDLTSGQTIQYAVVEEELPEALNYLTYYGEKDSGKTQAGVSAAGLAEDIINSHEPENATLEITKQWSDRVDRDGLRPDFIVFDVMKGPQGAEEATGVTIALTDPQYAGDTGATVALTATATDVANLYTNWVATTTLLELGLPKYEANAKVRYSLSEREVENYAPGYSSQYETNGVQKYFFINTHEPEAYEGIVVNKTWLDGDEAKPWYLSASVYKDEGAGWKQIASDGNSQVLINETINRNSTTLTANSTNTGPFYKYKVGPDGVVTDEPIVYTVTEYIGVTRPDGFQGTVQTTAGVASDDKGGYRVAVSPVSASDANADTLEFTITNAKLTDIAGVKQWTLLNGTEPPVQQVEMGLYNGQSQVATAMATRQNGWAYSFTGLPKYDAGNQLISYAVRELTGLTGFNSVAGEDRVLNSDERLPHDPDGPDPEYPLSETITVSGVKVWNDSANYDGVRPQSVELALYSNADDGTSMKEVARQTVTGTGDRWNFAFEDQPRYRLVSSGNNEYVYEPVAYEVREETVPDYYTMSGDGAVSEDYAIEITNSHAMFTTSVTAQKLWNDDENRDGLRPDSVTVELTANGQPTGQTAALNAANNWSYTFSGLTATGYSYGVIENDPPAGYEPAYAGAVVTNVHTPEQVVFAGVKTWNDDDNRDGKRPESVTINVYADGDRNAPAASAVASEATGWAYSISVPKYKDGGVEIAYELEEAPVPEYEAAYTEAGVTNTYAPALKSVTATKQWTGVDYAALLPDVRATLLADGQAVETVTLNAANNWSHTWEGLNAYRADAQGEPVAYSVSEEAAAGYVNTEIIASTENPEEDVTFTLVNELAEMTAYSVSKAWDDGAGAGTYRPSSIRVTLREGAGGDRKSVETVTLSAANGWRYDWTNLPAYNEKGERAVYSAVESRVPANYVGDSTASGTSLEITNTLRLTVTFVDWNGTVLGRTRVPYGGSAVAPGDPSRVGYTFTNWDGVWREVTRDEFVYARYAAIPGTPEADETLTLDAYGIPLAGAYVQNVGDCFE